MADAGSEIVRITVNNEAAAQAVPHIVERLRAQGCCVPIVGDFHYNGHMLLTKYPETARALDKYRINPGNVGTKRRDDNFRTIIEQAIKYGKPVRIGVNWGSLDQDLLTEMMDANARSDQPSGREDGDPSKPWSKAPSGPRRTPRSADWRPTASSSVRKFPACRT